MRISSPAPYRSLHYFVAALLCVFSGMSPVLAEADAEISEEEALPLEQLLTMQAAQLVFGDPPFISEATFNMSVQYTHIAKGFWVEKKCGFLAKLDGDGDAITSFNAKVAETTRLMLQSLAREDGFSPSSANEGTQKLQMYALNEMSAKSFYQCDENAWNILAYASKEAEIWVPTIDAADK